MVETNPTSRLLSKAERDALFVDAVMSVWTGKGGQSRAEAVQNLRDTADHWEAEFRVLFGVNLELQREVTRLVGVLGEIRTTLDRAPLVRSEAEQQIAAILAIGRSVSTVRERRERNVNDG
jgi:hypothetical protein